MIATTLVKIVATWLITDFLSGVIHWAEDSYGHPHTPIVGRYITKPDLLHHFQPRRIVENSWFASSDVLILVCLAALGVAAAVGRLSPMVVLAAVLGTNANQIHKFCHRSALENGPVITALQRWGLVQSPQHHHGHHVGGKDACYCVLTNFLNPLLDASRFWRGLERIVSAVFRVAKRDDDALIALVLSEEPGFLGDTVSDGGRR